VRERGCLRREGFNVMKREYTLLRDISRHGLGGLKQKYSPQTK